MLKAKTTKSIFKRVRKVSNNKFKFKHCNLRHILTKKRSKKKRYLRTKHIINKLNSKKLFKHVPFL